MSAAYVRAYGLLTLWVSLRETAGTAGAVLTIPLPAGFTAITLAGPIAAGVGTLGNTITAGPAISMTIAAGGTSLVSSIAVGGAVADWFGSFVVPITT